MQDMNGQAATGLLNAPVTGLIRIGNPAAEQVVNAPLSPVANFFKKEYKLALTAFWTKMAISLLLIGGSIACGLIIWLLNKPLWLEMFPAAVGVLCMAFGSITLVGFLSFRNELRTININSDARVVLPGLTKIYRRLSTRGVNTNWTCGGIYLFGTLAVLFTAIVVWAINLKETGKSDFGLLTLNGGDAVPLYVVYSFVGLICLSFLYHVTMTLLRQWRISRIDTFYGFQLVPQSELEEIRRFKNKRSRFVFFGMLIVTFFFFWLAYRLILKGRSLKPAK